MNGVTREDTFKNEYIGISIRGASILVKMKEFKLRWFGHVIKKERDRCNKIGKKNMFWQEGQKNTKKEVGIYDSK